MLAFGLVKYFSETFHYLDVAVSASSLIEILISVINGIALALNRSSPVSSVKGFLLFCFLFEFISFFLMVLYFVLLSSP